MYSNNILNVPESTTILNVCTKKSGNLLKASRIISESSKLAQKQCKTKQGWVGKLINKELLKRLIFDYVEKKTEKNMS